MGTYAEIWQRARRCLYDPYIKGEKSEKTLKNQKGSKLWVFLGHGAVSMPNFTLGCFAG